MLAALDSLTRFINSPAGVLAAGGVLFRIVYKFFEKVDGILNEDTRLEIAVWLLHRQKLTPSSRFQVPRSLVEGIETWLKEVHPTEASFKRTWKVLGIVTCILAVFSLLWQPNGIARKILAVYTRNGGFEASSFFGAFFFTSLFLALGTHAALFATRYVSARTAKSSSNWELSLLLSANVLMTPLFSCLGVAFLFILGSFDPDVRSVVSQAAGRTLKIGELVESSRLAISQTVPFGILAIPMMAAGAFTTGFVCFAIGAGFLLKAARRFDIGFQWFNRYMDIEKKPLQSIGLVAGAIVALVYWGAVVLVRILNRS